MLDTHSIQSPSLQHRARGTDHNSWKEIARIYMVFSFGFPPTQTIYSSGQKPWSASDWNLYPQLGKHHSPPPIFPVFHNTPQWVLDAFRQRNIFCLASLATKPNVETRGPLKAPAVFSSQPVWNAVAVVPLWPAPYGTAPLQRRDFTGICAAELGNDQRIFLCTSNKSSLV